MILRYQDKSINLMNCKSFYSRLKGFIGCKIIDKALLFKHCNSIHTFFMKKNIDVIMCNDENLILFYYRDLPKNRIIWPKKNVTRVFETPSCYFDIHINDYMEVEE